MPAVSFGKHLLRRRKITSEREHKETPHGLAKLTLTVAPRLQQRGCYQNKTKGVNIQYRHHQTLISSVGLVSLSVAC